MVEFVVAIDEARVRFTDDANQFIFAFFYLAPKGGKGNLERFFFSLFSRFPVIPRVFPSFLDVQSRLSGYLYAALAG